MLRLAPRPSPSPVSAAKPRKWGNQPAPGSTWTEPVRTAAVVVEELLRAVAVVGVDVDDGDVSALGDVEERRGRDRGVVEVAGAAEAVARRVMARRSGAGVGGAFAARDEVDGRQRRVGGAAHGLPGAGPDERHRVVGEPAGARGRIRRLRSRARGPSPGGGRDRGRPAVDPGPRGCRRRPSPPRPWRGRRVGRGHERRAAPSRDARSRRRCLRAACLQLGADPVGARRHLSRRSANPDPDLGVRLVRSVALVPDDRHRKAHRAAP